MRRSAWIKRHGRVEAEGGAPGTSAVRRGKARRAEGKSGAEAAKEAAGVAGSGVANEVSRGDSRSELGISE